jgi:hypothetical protein
LWKRTIIFNGVCLTQKRMNNFLKAASHWELSIGSWGIDRLLWSIYNWVFAVLTLLVQEIRRTAAVISTFCIFCCRDAFTWRGCNDLLELRKCMLMLREMLWVYTWSINGSSDDLFDTCSDRLISLIKASLVYLRGPLAPSNHFIETATF